MDNYSSEGGLFLSMYIDNENMSRDAFKQKVKSQTTIAFRDNKDPQIQKLDQDKISERMQDCIDSLDSLEKGVAIFMDLKGERTEVMSLAQKPKYEVQLGEVLDLDQLIWINTTAVPGIIINLNNDDAKIYWAIGQLELLFQLENNFVTSRETKENMGHSPSQGMAVFGTGTDKAQKDWAKALQEFSNQVLAELKRNREQIEKAEMGMVIYTQLFADCIDKFESEIKRMFPNFREVIKLNKDISNEKELKRIVDDEIYTIRIRKMDENYLDAKEGFYNFVEGWKDVSQAVRDQKVETLFVKMNTKVTGFADDEGRIYEYEIDGSRKIQDIAPWLIKNTIDSGGKVEVFPESNTLLDSVAAKLRY